MKALICECGNTFLNKIWKQRSEMTPEEKEVVEKAAKKRQIGYCMCPTCRSKMSGRSEFIVFQCQVCKRYKLSRWKHYDQMKPDLQERINKMLVFGAICPKCKR